MIFRITLHIDSDSAISHPPSIQPETLGHARKFSFRCQSLFRTPFMTFLGLILTSRPSNTLLKPEPGRHRWLLYASAKISPFRAPSLSMPSSAFHVWPQNSTKARSCRFQPTGSCLTTLLAAFISPAEYPYVDSALSAGYSSILTCSRHGTGLSGKPPPTPLFEQALSSKFYAPSRSWHVCACFKPTSLATLPAFPTFRGITSVKPST